MAMWGTPIPDLLKELETTSGAEKVDVYHYLALAHKFIDKKQAVAYADQALALCEAEGLRKEVMDYHTVRAILESGATAEDSERAIEHLQRAVEVAIEVNNEEGRLAALQKIGWHKLRQHKTVEAGQILMQCIEDYKALPDTMAKDEGYRNAALYMLNVDLKAAAELSLKGLELVKVHGRPVDQVHHIQMLQKIALKSGDDDKAIEYGLEILRIKDENNDQTSRLTVSKKLGQLYLKRGEIELAQRYFLGEIKLHNDPVNTERKHLLQITDAETYFHAGMKDAAMGFAREAVEQAVKDNNPRALGNAEYQMGHILFLHGDYGQAAAFLERSITTKGEDLPAIDHIATLDLMHQCYEKTGQYKAAYESLLRKVAVDANLVNTERVKEVTLLNQRYESEKRESELRELKIKQQMVELERSESELKAIKAQMNPHFIFNALNSIQEMFFIGDKRLANEHLGKFSQLTRDILKASGKTTITLSEEIDMLTKYLELEGLRFESDFTFSIHVNDENAADDIMLPPMLIQPYVENAIRHGLLHKKGNKEVAIKFLFDEAGSQLTCIIEDNGVGREAAAQINKSRSSLHESFSTSANAKRLELLNQTRDEKIGVTYDDMPDGTKVTIVIPVMF
jgi:tetratricopeptide (TPR) repeat protein